MLRKDRNKLSQVSELSPVVDDGEPVDVEAIARLIKGIVEPLAESQKISHVESTKRAEISARLASGFFRHFFGIAFLMLGIAVAALFLGQIQLAEKIVFGVIVFLGGAAFGKAGSSK